MPTFKPSPAEHFTNPFGGPAPPGAHAAASHPAASKSANAIIAGSLAGAGTAAAAASAGLVTAAGVESALAPVFGAAAIPLALAGLGVFLAGEFQGKPKLVDTQEAQARLAQSQIPAFRDLAADLDIWVRNGVPLSTGIPQLRAQLTQWIAGALASIPGLTQAQRQSLDPVLWNVLASERALPASALDTVVNYFLLSNRQSTQLPSPAPVSQGEGQRSTQPETERPKVAPSPALNFWPQASSTPEQQAELVAQWANPPALPSWLEWTTTLAREAREAVGLGRELQDKLGLGWPGLNGQLETSPELATLSPRQPSRRASLAPLIEPQRSPSSTRNLELQQRVREQQELEQRQLQTSELDDIERQMDDLGKLPPSWPREAQKRQLQARLDELLQASQRLSASP